MTVISKETVFDLHTISGFVAIALMIFHAMWATRVMIKNDEQKKTSFHKFSLLVWSLWLIPYATGALQHM